MTLVLPAEQERLMPRVVAALPAAIVMVYAVAQVVLFSTHDAWHDEAHAWLLVEQLQGLDFLIVPGEGHPPVWFWVVKLLSSFLSFDQARAAYVAVSILNAILLTRLLKSNVVLLALLLGSGLLLHSWGYQFRPYALVVTCLVSALLLDRAGRTTAATWALAIACGLHFFSGLFIALYLLIQLRRGRSLRPLIAPAVLAALFGLNAVLSSLGNQESDVETAKFALRFLDVLSRPFRLRFMPMWLGAVVGVALITVGLRKDRFVLVVLAALILGYATFATLVYGASPWHIAFVPMLILMAFLLAEPQGSKWPVVIMLIPLFVQGIGGAIIYSRFPDRDESASFAAIVADAGDRLQPTENLVAWPEFIGSAAAARYDFSYLSGNTGDVVRVRDRRTARFKQMDIEFLMNHPGPYWLLCEMCDIVVTVIKASGRSVTPLYGPAVYRHDMYVGAFRID